MSDAARPWRIDTTPDPVACARTLAAAFAREPAVSWICGHSQAVRTHWFETTLRTHATLDGARRHTLVDPDGAAVAAAVLTPPRATPTVGARALWVARTGVRPPGPRPHDHPRSRGLLPHHCRPGERPLPPPFRLHRAAAHLPGPPGDHGDDPNRRRLRNVLTRARRGRHRPARR